MIRPVPFRGHGTYKRAVGGGGGEEYGDSSTLRLGEEPPSSLGGNNNVGSSSSHHHSHSRGHRRTQSGSASEVTEQLSDMAVGASSMEAPPASEDVRRRSVLSSVVCVSPFFEFAENC